MIKNICFHIIEASAFISPHSINFTSVERWTKSVTSVHSAGIKFLPCAVLRIYQPPPNLLPPPHGATEHPGPVTPHVFLSLQVCTMLSIKLALSLNMGST